MTGAHVTPTLPRSASGTSSAVRGFRSMLNAMVSAETVSGEYTTGLLGSTIVGPIGLDTAISSGAPVTPARSCDRACAAPTVA